jgi:hypothetical protein
MENTLDTHTKEQSRRTFIHAAVASAATAMPFVASVVFARKAQADPLCEFMTCGCIGVLYCNPPGTFGCGADCFDAHTDAWCGRFCGYSPCYPC